MKLVLATHNRDKVSEILHILSDLDVDVADLDAFPGAPETVEDGDTLEANALKKAREILEFTSCSALADDTGLEVDALDGAPGVYSSRFAGENAGYERNCDKLLRDLGSVERSRRAARFRTVIALALTPADAEVAGAEVLVAEGILPGEITEERRGEGGFGYDPIFFDPEAGKTLAEMSADEKNSRSHRYRALVEMRELMLRINLLHEAQ